MPGDAAPPTGFHAGIANLRETTKWLLSGTLGVASLIAGGASFSDLGDMEPGRRLWMAAGAFVVAALALSVIVYKAARVLRSQIWSLKDFTTAPRGELKKAADEIAEDMAEALPNGMGLREFEQNYSSLRVGLSAEHAKQLSATRKFCRDACAGALVDIRFGALMWTLIIGGLVAMIALLVFAWAANAPDEPSPKLLDPYVEPLDGKRLARLSVLGVPPACLNVGAQLVVVAAPEEGPHTAILVGPQPYPAECIRRVTLSNGIIVKAS